MPTYMLIDTVFLLYKCAFFPSLRSISNWYFP